MKRSERNFIIPWIVLFLGAGGVRAQEADHELVQKLNNPVSDLVSVPFQFNWDNGVGPQDDTRFIMNLQPVVPFSLSEEWSLIGRWIMPVVSQPMLSPGGGTAFGMGDIVASAFFSPKKSSGITWGLGPVVSLPTTTNPLLGSGKWSAGPTGVILKQQGPWTVGALVNHLWSFADTGDPERDAVNQTLLQPFLAYSTKAAVTYTLNSESTANWEAASGEQWTVPIQLVVSKVTRFGPFPFSIGGGVGWYAESPTGGPDWKLRTVFTVLLPGGK